VQNAVRPEDLSHAVDSRKRVELLSRDSSLPACCDDAYLTGVMTNS
jgi:hypothetical protein